MRYNEFLTENIKLKPELKDLAQKIKRDCQPYLNAVHEPFIENCLYRGIDVHPVNLPIVHKKVYLDDRKPADTLSIVHDKVNEIFIEKFGEPFRNAMFAAGTLSTAGSYGLSYIIFPIGDFKALWSPDITDMYTLYRRVKNAAWDAGAVMADNWEDVFYDNIRNAEWSSDIQAGIKSESEIMVRCKEYYGIKLNAIGGVELYAMEQLML